jgi:hypothetical protein
MDPANRQAWTEYLADQQRRDQLAQNPSIGPMNPAEAAWADQYLNSSPGQREMMEQQAAQERFQMGREASYDRRGYGAVARIFDRALNPMWDGTGNFNDLMFAMGGFAVPMAGAAPVAELKSHGRRGTPEIRAHLDFVRDEFLANNPGFEHFRGGTDAKTRKSIPELYVPGPNGARRGSAYPDLTFYNPVTGEYVHVNTVDTNADGTMTAYEAANFQKIYRLTNQPIIAVPKPKSGR